MRRFKLTREKLELTSVLLIVVCGLSVLPLAFKEKTALTYDDGKISYTGYVVNNRMNGQGKLTYENGDVYERQFTNGVFNGQADGQGTLKAKNEEVYTGTFVQGIYQK